MTSSKELLSACIKYVYFEANIKYRPKRILLLCPSWLIRQPYHFKVLCASLDMLQEAIVPLGLIFRGKLDYYGSELYPCAGICCLL